MCAHGAQENYVAFGVCIYHAHTYIKSVGSKQMNEIVTQSTRNHCRNLSHMSLLAMILNIFLRPNKKEERTTDGSHIHSTHCNK